MIHSMHALFPNNNNDLSPTLTLGLLISTVGIFVIGNIIRVPLSVTSSLTGTLVGISTAKQVQIDKIFISYVIAVWTIGPAASIVAAFYLMKTISKTATPKNVWTRIKMYKAAIIIASILTAYASDANTLALIVAISSSSGGGERSGAVGFGIMQLSTAIVAIIIGSLFLSTGQIKRVGAEMYSLRYLSALVTTLTSSALILFASVYGIPLSSTQTLTSTVFGTGLSQKDRFMAMKPFLMIVMGWIIAPFAGLAIGMVLPQ